MQYTTKYIVNLATGEPFEFEVSELRIEMLRTKTISIESYVEGDDNRPRYTVEELTKNFECSLFPSCEDVERISFGNGYTEELMTKILTDFGLSAEVTASIVANESYKDSVYREFEGIACDGDRVCVAMKASYYAAKAILL